MINNDLVFAFLRSLLLALVVIAGIIYLWNLIFHSAGRVDWETVFRFGIVFAIIQSWILVQELKETNKRGK